MGRVASLVSVGVVAVLMPCAAPRAVAASTAKMLTGIVVYVDDGDTIDVRIGDRVERVRYIGIDAPEIAHGAGHGRPSRRGAPGGVSATRINAGLVAGRPVRLEIDVEPRDRYGRLLAYVWVGSTMINAELVAQGYARATPKSPNLRYASMFAQLESQARAVRRGLWSLHGLWAERDGSREKRDEVATVRARAKPARSSALGGRQRGASLRRATSVGPAGPDRHRHRHVLADHARAGSLRPPWRPRII